MSKIDGSIGWKIASFQKRLFLWNCFESKHQTFNAVEMKAKMNKRKLLNAIFDRRLAQYCYFTQNLSLLYSL